MGVRSIGRVRVALAVLALLVAGLLAGGDRDGAAAGPAGTPVAEATPVVALRVMPLGASSTEGVGSPATAGYRGPLYAMLQRDAVAVDFVGSRSSGPASLPDRDNEGHPGATLAVLTPHVAAWVAAGRPDVVLLHAGTNDLEAGTPAAVAAARLDDVIGRIFAAAPHSSVVVAGVWAPLPNARAARAELAALTPSIVARYRAAGRSIVFLDTSDLLGAGQLADGLHPNASGYERIARLFDRQILRLLGR